MDSSKAKQIAHQMAAWIASVKVFDFIDVNFLPLFVIAADLWMLRDVIFKRCSVLF